MNFLPDQLSFYVAPSLMGMEARPNSVILVEDGWDDWFIWSTVYSLFVFDLDGKRVRIGDLKIGQFDMAEGQRRPDLQEEFQYLDERFFSLGQDALFYEALNKLGGDVRLKILRALNDVAFDLDLWKDAQVESVTKRSLLRSVSATEVEGQFHRMTLGGVRLTEFHFRYTSPKRTTGTADQMELTFKVVPDSKPPTNIHVLIGRNGVGKTHTLNLMTKALVGKSHLSAQSGNFATNLTHVALIGSPFANLVSVCFSAFDSFILESGDFDPEQKVGFAYVGLRKVGPNLSNPLTPKSPAMLATEFVNSVIECGIGPRADRLKNAVKTLEGDPIFRAANVVSFIGVVPGKEWREEVKRSFKKLSSGHQIVLLTLTRLVETVEEKTLVLLDEPEGHLHPPLLSAFIRALSDLLQDRNGVAVIATHSPVVIQEVPRDCVWKLQRSGHSAIAERPEIQTFGENVGVLTREIFGYEVTDSGFHQILRETAEETLSYAHAVNQFGGELGAEARAILRGMFLRKEAESEETS